MNYPELAKAIERRVNLMDKPDQFRFWASWYGGLPYRGGSENPIYGADCSGTVCGPLWMMGYNIRCTADELRRWIFTDEVDDYESRDEIMAVFYSTTIEREHFGRMVQPGYAIHVTPVIGRYVVQNAFDPIEPMTASYVRAWYESNDAKAEWRQLNWVALQEHSERRDIVAGIDPVLEAIRSGREVYGG